MFFQLQEITRLTKITNQLSNAKERLNSLVIDAYQSKPTVTNSLNDIIENILSQAKEKIKMFQQIQNQSINGYLIPSFLDFQSLTSDKGDLPEWTRVVLQKQFEKQKKSLDIMTKKLYNSHCLSEAKDKVIRQFNSFKILSERYKSLSDHNETIDIMNEAEKLKNIVKLVRQKYQTFCSLVASRLSSFIEEMTSKCCNFSSEINKFVGNSTNTWIQPQRPNPDISMKNDYNARMTTGGWLSHAHRSQDMHFYRSAKSQNTLLRQPKWLSTFTSDYYN